MLRVNRVGCRGSSERDRSTNEGVRGSRPHNSPMDRLDHAAPLENPSRFGCMSAGEQVIRLWDYPPLTVMYQMLAVIPRAGYRLTDLKATHAPFRMLEGRRAATSVFARRRRGAEGSIVAIEEGGGCENRRFNARESIVGSAR